MSSRPSRLPCPHSSACMLIFEIHLYLWHSALLPVCVCLFAPARVCSWPTDLIVPRPYWGGWGTTRCWLFSFMFMFFRIKPVVALTFFLLFLKMLFKRVTWNLPPLRSLVCVSGMKRFTCLGQRRHRPSQASFHPAELNSAAAEPC